jgi:signal transduction histidine kinase
VFAIGGVAAAAVVLFAVPLAIVLQRSYREEELLRLQRDTVAATRHVDLPTRGRDPVELPRSRDRLGVYDTTGRRVAGGGPPRADAVVVAALRTGRTSDRAGGGMLVVAAPLLAGERVTGALRGARDEGGAARDTRAAWLLIAALAAALVTLAGLAAVVLARRLSGPLERLAVAARRLGEGDFSVRAPRSSVAEVDAVGSALDATAGRLDDLIGRERAFSADASHQLRTPLAALRLELEAAELRGDPPPELAAALAQVERLERTIETLLAVARDAPRRDTTVDLGAVVDDAEARWRGALAARGRPLRTLVRDDAPIAAAAPRVVSEILDVLLENACEHGAGPVTVTVRAASGSLAVDVGDEGAGFAGDPDAAFARRTGSANGHGIGLALARSLAHAEGGQLLPARPGAHPVLTLLLARAQRSTPV